MRARFTFVRALYRQNFVELSAQKAFIMNICADISGKVNAIQFWVISQKANQ